MTGSVSSVAGIAGANAAPASTWSETNFGVTWIDGRSPSGHYFRLLGPDGAKIGSDVFLGAGETLTPDSMLAIAWNGAEYGMVFNTDDGTRDCCGISFVRARSTGAKLGSAVEVTARTTTSNHLMDITWRGTG